jgi:hypothetical protein
MYSLPPDVAAKECMESVTLLVSAAVMVLKEPRIVSVWKLVPSCKVPLVVLLESV